MERSFAQGQNGSNAHMFATCPYVVGGTSWLCGFEAANPLPLRLEMRWNKGKTRLDTSRVPAPDFAPAGL